MTQGKDTLYKKRHSLAHLLAAAVLKRDPDAKIAIGPVIENGFYYDIEPGTGTSFSESDLKDLQRTMRKLISQHIPFIRKEVTEQEARQIFAHQPYKLELIDKIVKEGKPITVYESGPFVDLCEGPHVNNTDEIDPDAFCLDRVAGAYWQGDETKPMLTRIYGLAFNTPQELTEYLTRRDEARKRDHKKLGAELDLFYIDEMVGKGLPMWTPKGTAVKLKLEQFTRSLERTYGYQHVSTPYLGGASLYETSGHLAHYKEDMYAPIDMDGDIFYLRPMACPHHIRLLQRKPISYRDLPVRYAEIADYNRYEKSGELMGMIRVRKFQLTDAHLFVTPQQLKDEFKNVCLLIQDGMRGIGLDQVVSYRFSKRDPQNKEKYYPDDTLWEKAESVMKDALDEIGFSYTEAEDEAAFYGPKLDVQARNVNGKEDTLFTAQIDFLLPEKFNLTYTDKDGAERRPVMIHRSAIGSLERTFAFLIEHYGGAFPFWMSPEQVRVLPVSETYQPYAREVYDTLFAGDFAVQLDDAPETLGKKIRRAKMDKVPFFIVIGEREMSSRTITLESREQKIGVMTVPKLVEYLRKERESGIPSFSSITTR